MIKLSKRLATIASFCDPKDKVIDVGCDHGLLSIYLKDKVTKILATDINPASLNQACHNFYKYHINIPILNCDGINIKEIDEYNTLIIAGMGAYTIKHILNNPSKLTSISKIIISSHNHQEIVREYLNSLGFYLDDEKIIYDKKYYFIMKFIKKDIKHSPDINKYGIIKPENVNYYEWIIKKNKSLYEQDISKAKKEQILSDIRFYKDTIEKIGDQEEE